MIVDANILVSAVLDSSVNLERATVAGLDLIVPDAQLAEAKKVLAKKFAFDDGDAAEAVDAVAGAMAVVDTGSLVEGEADARARLGARGQSDWPVLAAAMMLDGHIWTKDRDFFGVGVAVWSPGNIRFAGAGA